MNIQFFDSHPLRPLAADLRADLAAARKIDVAVAFVTAYGVAVLRQFLKGHPLGSARLVASIRFPTDLAALANLEDEFPGTVRLHTGFKQPEEAAADRGQFHSKVNYLSGICPRPARLDGTEMAS